MHPPKLPLWLDKLLGWYLITYFVVIYLRGLLQPGQAEWTLEEMTAHRVFLIVTSHLSFAGYAVGAYLLLRHAYRRWHGWLIGAALLVLTLGDMLVRALLQEGLLYAVFGAHNYNPAMTWGAYLRDNLYYAIIFLPVGIVYFFAQYGRHNEAVRHRTEVAFREAELTFLRSQINPHFLFNTLNNLYALVSSDSPHALPVLEKLSGLLRYSLYGQEDSVPLSRELAYVADLVELEGLRVPGLVAPVTVVSGELEGWEVSPLLLLPFVENAFKHGRLDVPRQPLRIDVEADCQTLRFRVVNALRDQPAVTDAVGGIGLANVRKRLELLYSQRHRLHIEQSATCFSVDLTLQRSPE